LVEEPFVYDIKKCRGLVFEWDGDRRRFNIDSGKIIFVCDYL
jgi:hypothetical protein